MMNWEKFYRSQGLYGGAWKLDCYFEKESCRQDRFGSSSQEIWVRGRKGFESSTVCALLGFEVNGCRIIEYLGFGFIFYSISELLVFVLSADVGQVSQRFQ